MEDAKKGRAAKPLLPSFLPLACFVRLYKGSESDAVVEGGGRDSLNANDGRGEAAADPSFIRLLYTDALPSRPMRFFLWRRRKTVVVLIAVKLCGAPPIPMSEFDGDVDTR